jgi:dienelactone hydrolase
MNDRRPRFGAGTEFGLQIRSSTTALLQEATRLQRRRPAPPVWGTILLAIVAAAGCTRSPAPTANNSNNANRASAPTMPASGPSDPGAPQTVTFSTEDDANVVVTGDLYLPEKSPAPAVLALHQWNANRSSYKDLARALRDAGFVVLAVDGRGFGESTQSVDGKVEPAWSLTNDIAAAIEYLKSQPSVDGQRIGIVGASYGASNALIYAADNPRDVRSVALLSVGLNYHDTLPTEPALKKYGDRPLLMMAARDDAESAADTEKLAAAVKSSKYTTKVYAAGGHGTALLDPKVGAVDVLKAFFVKTLTGPIAEREDKSATTAGDIKGGEPGSEPSAADPEGGKEPKEKL